MKNFISLSLFMSLSLYSFSQAHFEWQEYLEKDVLSNDFYNTSYNDYHAAKNNEWFKDYSYSYSLNKKSPADFNFKSSKSCSDKVFPAHPYALTKSYHYAVWKRFDHKLLQHDSYSCLTTSRHRKIEKRVCLRSGTLHFAVLSDTYVDECGNYFRAFFTVAYNSDDENMGTLISKGRTVKTIQDSIFKNDYEAAESYAVSTKEFFFLSPLFEKDLEKIKKYRLKAARSKKFNTNFQKKLVTPLKELVPKAKVF